MPLMSANSVKTLE